MPIAAIWNVGSLRLLEALAQTGVLPRRIFAELFTTEGGLIAGHPGTPRGLAALVDFVPRSIDCDWSVACHGASNLELARIAIEQGGHVSIGLGDYAYPELAGGEPTNAEVVAEVVVMAHRAGRAIATPAEVRAHFMETC